MLDRTLKAKTDDQRNSREHFRKVNVIRSVTIGGVILLFLVFTTIALLSGYKDVAFEVIKMMAAFTAGGAAGYGIRGSGAKVSEQSSEPETNPNA